MFLSFSGQTVPPVSVLNSGWSHQGESLPAQEPGPPANLDGDPGRLPEGDPEDASAQVVGALPFLLSSTCLPLSGASHLHQLGGLSLRAQPLVALLSSQESVSTAPSGHEGLTLNVFT